MEVKLSGQGVREEMENALNGVLSEAAATRVREDAWETDDVCAV
jgi:hypothetical protein